MAKTSNGAGRAWRAKMAEGLRAARAARNGGSAAPRAPLSAAQRASLLLIGLLLFAASLAVLNFGAPPLSVRLGDRARTDIRARVAFEYNDPDAFNQKRQEARNSTPAVYTYSPRWAESVLAAVDQLVVAKLNAEKLDEADKRLEDFRKRLLERKLISDPKVAEPIWRALESFGGLDRQIRQPLLRQLKDLESAGVLSDERWSAETASGRPRIIERRPKSLADKRGKETGIDLIYPEERARRLIEDDIEYRFAAHWKEFKTLLRGMILGRLKPNLTYERELSEAARNAAVAAVRPEVTRRVKGDTLLRAGDEIGLKEMLILRAENRKHWAEAPPRVRLLRLGGLFLTVAVLFGVTILWVRRADPAALRQPRQLFVVGLLGLAALAAARAAGEFDWPVEVVPAVFFGMVAVMVYSVRCAAALAVLVSALAAVALGGGFGAVPVLAAGALAGALAGSQPRHRLEVLKAALYAGLVAAAAAAGWRLLEGSESPLPVLRESGWALGAALAQGLILAGALPVLEAALGSTTSISLLELCDQNHSLLKALFLNAPGSHQHSMVVAQLAETAAEAVGADPLLTRAGSYYHDIGKIARPEYFVENAPPGLNRHDRLGNSMSAMVVISHVRDGVELAREYRLPRSVIDVIGQHHGTTLAEFFYRRALESGEDPAESIYRYPGPRPQTKEAAIVLLADTVEAASRTLEQPSVARIKSMVHELASRRLLDGQFDECGLTLKELAAVEAAFRRILISMFHARVAYPEAPDKKRENGPPEK